MVNLSYRVLTGSRYWAAVLKSAYDGLVERCWYCKKDIVYVEGIPGAWLLADAEDDAAAFACDGWFQGVHLPAEVVTR